MKKPSDDLRIHPGDLPAVLTPPVTLRLWYNENNSSNGPLHVRAVVDGDQYVVRQWGRRRRRWQYRVESILFFEVNARHGDLYRS